MLLFRKERSQFLHRTTWVWLITGISLLLGLAPYFWAMLVHGTRLDWFRGSSIVGFWCGAIGGIFIVFEMLYWVRRKWRGYPSDHFWREHLSGHPYGRARDVQTRMTVLTRNAFAIVTLPVRIPLAIFTAFLGFLLSNPLWANQSDGRMSNLRDGLNRSTRLSWEWIKFGLWPVVSLILLLFQILLLPIWAWAILTAGWRVRSNILWRFGCKTEAEAAKLDDDKQQKLRQAYLNARSKEGIRLWRLFFPARIWLQGHILFGFLALIAITIHTGYRTGGPMTTLLTTLFALVILSGVFGLWMQQFRPIQIRDEVGEETIASQIDFVMERRFAEAERIFEESTHLSWRHPYWEHAEMEGIREAATESSWVIQTQSLPKVDLRFLREWQLFFQNELRPYLLEGRRSHSVLRSSDGANRIFARIRASCTQEFYKPIDSIEYLCNTRRELDRQQKLHWWLHAWLLIHLPLSVAMFGLMLIHVVVALKLFW